MSYGMKGYIEAARTEYYERARIASASAEAEDADVAATPAPSMTYLRKRAQELMVASRARRQAEQGAR